MHKHENALEQLMSQVLSSAKYRGTSPHLIESIGSQELAKRRNLKEAVKATKNKLHQISRVYLDEHEDYTSWLDQLAVAISSGDQAHIQQVCRQIMAHHASTKERLPILDQFYSTLLAKLPPPSSVLDIACGFNPLALPWMSLAPNAHYYAYDIHQPMIDFLNHALALLQVNGQAQVSDVLQASPTCEVDVAFLLKALPCLEQLNKQASYQLLRELKARYVIVSFPAHSLSGQCKGMTSYYETHFRSLIAQEPWEIERYEFATELVFLVTK